MDDISIFDALTHPTLDGNWILPKYPNIATIDSLINQMKINNIRWALTVGMEGIGNYDALNFINLIYEQSVPKLYPIAFFNPTHYNNILEIKERLLHLKKSGFIGIKLHPRFSNFSFNEHIANIINCANDISLVTLLCTYCYNSNVAVKNTPELLAEMLSKTNNSKIILMHSGTVRLKEYIELARFYKNILLDLSFTIVKYEGSSIDLDIQFAFNRFDQRLCVGSDFPEISLFALRQRFNYFAKNIDRSKAENIANLNLKKFLNID